VDNFVKNWQHSRRKGAPQRRNDRTMTKKAVNSSMKSKLFHEYPGLLKGFSDPGSALAARLNNLTFQTVRSNRGE
jgi:hypothetical protein